MADLLKGLFNKKKKVVATEPEKPAAAAKPSESEKPAAAAKPVKSEEKAAPPPKAPAPEPRRYVAPQEDANSFFLDADSAKTFGNIDYMRTAKAVRKTFPKVLGAKEGAEIVEITSSLDKVEGSAGSIPQAPKSVTPEIIPSRETSDRRRQDTSMEMFRNMAKGIKK